MENVLEGREIRQNEPSQTSIDRQCLAADGGGKRVSIEAVKGPKLQEDAPVGIPGLKAG